MTRSSLLKFTLRSFADIDDAVAAQVAAPVPSGLPVEVTAQRIRSHQRMNLCVTYAKASAAQRAGALFDDASGIFYVAPRAPLYPFREWLP